MTEPKKRQYVVTLKQPVPARHKRLSQHHDGLVSVLPRSVFITEWYSVDAFGMLCFRVDEREIHVPLHMLVSITELVE